MVAIASSRIVRIPGVFVDARIASAAFMPSSICFRVSGGSDASAFFDSSACCFCSSSAFFSSSSGVPSNAGIDGLCASRISAHFALNSADAV